jgi:hypothetical protein
VRAPKGSCAIDEHVGVMNDLRRGRQDLHGADEIAKDVGARGAEVI